MGSGRLRLRRAEWDNVFTDLRLDAAQAQSLQRNADAIIAIERAMSARAKAGLIAP